jgi:hypothetical protein
MTIHSSITTCCEIEAPGEKLMKRRAVLAGLTLLTAPITVLPHIASDLPLFPLDGSLSHPVLALPFVRNTTLREQAAGAAPRCFWSVQPTGNYGPDCATGAHYAALALAYMVKSRTPQILQWAVCDMMTAGRGHSGIEVGFLSVFGRLAAQAHARTTLGKGAIV